MMRGWREQDRWSGRRARGGSGTEGEDWIIGMWRIKGEAEKILWAEMRKGWKGGQIGGFKKDNSVKEVERRGSEGLHWGKVSGAIWNGERRMRSNLEAERMTKWWSGKENGGGIRTRKSSQQRWLWIRKREESRNAELISSWWIWSPASTPTHSFTHTHTHSPALSHTHTSHGGQREIEVKLFLPRGAHFIFYGTSIHTQQATGKTYPFVSVCASVCAPTFPSSSGEKLYLKMSE